ncbi:MAG: glycosyltransferase family 2 protein [Patescibacteria group bacterium]|nr:glycosyltransferase [Patescibacteria group bacterium]
MSSGIVIINYNLAKDAGRLLEQFRKQELAPGMEIFLVDNGEFDRQGKRLDLEKALGKERLKGFRVFYNKENRGFGFSCNQIARKIDKKYLVFLNPDCQISLKGIERLIEVLKRNKEVGIVGPRLMKSEKVEQKWSGGGKRRVNKQKAWEEVGWLSGACLVVRKKDFLGLGGFDRRFFMYFEDKDLCFRARKKGWKVVRLLGVKAFHGESKSRIEWKQRKRMYYKSQALFWAKHYGKVCSFFLKIIRIPVYIKNVYLFCLIFVFTSIFAGLECWARV